MPALQAFEYGYLFRMVGNGYMQKYLVEGNDSRGIDVAVLMREKTRHGEPIEMVDIRSHALLTYNDLRSEEHTYELQSLMRHSYAVFCLKKKNITTENNNTTR